MIPVSARDEARPDFTAIPASIPAVGRKAAVTSPSRIVHRRAQRGVRTSQVVLGGQSIPRLPAWTTSATCRADSHVRSSFVHTALVRIANSCRGVVLIRRENRPARDGRIPDVVKGTLHDLEFDGSRRLEFYRAGGQVNVDPSNPVKGGQRIGTVSAQCATHHAGDPVPVGTPDSAGGLL